MTKYNVARIHQQNLIEIFFSIEPLGQGHPNSAQSILELIQKRDDNFFYTHNLAPLYALDLSEIYEVGTGVLVHMNWTKIKWRKKGF